MGQIWSLRSTNGGGKTTLARRFIPVRAQPVELISWPSPTKKDPGRYRPIVGYLRDSRALGRVAVIGPYSAACGGLDQLPCFQASREAIFAALEGQRAPHVIAEGLLASGVTGSWAVFAREMQQLGHCYNWTYLSTPLEVCKERVRARQALKGSTREIQWELVESKYSQVRATRERALAAGFPVWDLPWENQAITAEAMTAIMMGKGEKYRA